MFLVLFDCYQLSSHLILPQTHHSVASLANHLAQLESVQWLMRRDWSLRSLDQLPNTMSTQYYVPLRLDPVLLLLDWLLVRPEQKSVRDLRELVDRFILLIYHLASELYSSLRGWLRVVRLLHQRNLVRDQLTQFRRGNLPLLLTLPNCLSFLLRNQTSWRWPASFFHFKLLRYNVILLPILYGMYRHLLLVRIRLLRAWGLRLIEIIEIHSKLTEIDSVLNHQSFRLWRWQFW